ncbi:YjgN family protein [Photobacterium galatheae]|uniref:Uncharacterized protein n=1 Tax=Photobacterium galatheae TaxID=1654360 RepID=A0A066RTH6_9GAMM|nr:YjgN family protein [Photobacterium galatheae]KDM92426.1 hypothetical protein EA58_05645 [Photobacterium galatheae]MCM0147906.1 DUF898 domain-containing protein [Photobacterium galatheae]
MNNKVIFHGRGGEFFGIWIVNILLSFVTLGIYSAWAKVRTKKYFYGNLELAGDRFDYHATPKQILIGRLIAFVCVLIWAIASNFMPTFASLLMLAFVAIYPLLARNNARFDARMTSYRNVRFNFNGSLKGAYWAMLGCGFFSMIPLVILMVAAASVIDKSLAAGIVFIVLSVAGYFFMFANVTATITRYFANGYQYGDRLLSAEIRTRFFIKTTLLASLLGLGILAAMVGLVVVVAGAGALTSFATGQLDGHNGALWPFFTVIILYLGLFLMMVIVSAFMKARVRNYTFAQLKTDGELEYGFASTLRTAAFVWLIVTNFFAQVVTLGLARPWVMVRTSRYLADNTAVIGDLALLKAKGEVADDGAAIADEVAAAFDVEMGLG